MKDYASFTLAASLLILTVTSPNVCLAQGISEYGGVMGIPKPVPKPEAAAGALNTLYGLPSRAANSAAAAADAHSRTNAVTAGGKKQKPGAKPKGAVVKSGDIPSNTVAATRQALIEHSRQAKELLDKANDAKSKGKIDEAEQLYAKSLQIREAYWRDTDKEIPNIQYKLGELYAQKGDLKKAEGT